MVLGANGEALQKFTVGSEMKNSWATFFARVEHFVQLFKPKAIALKTPVI
jgi:hypothetical protein